MARTEPPKVNHHPNATRASDGRMARADRPGRRKADPSTPELVALPLVSTPWTTKGFTTFDQGEGGDKLDFIIIGNGRIYVTRDHPLSAAPQVELVLRPVAKPARKPRKPAAKKAA